MREPLIKGSDVLRERMKAPEQVDVRDVEAEMPPYMESFLAHLRMLVGVPFEHLIPDERLLPDESIRFFYLDRSWTDRLVDGAVAVGQIGSREQAHAHAHVPNASSVLDGSERMVRKLQRGKTFEDAKAEAAAAPAKVVTGLIIRSSAVAGWPHMDVRAYKRAIPEPMDASSDVATGAQLNVLRIERLAPSVLIALFEGDAAPELVTLEEPHHGVQFGVEQLHGVQVSRRQPDGQLLSGARTVEVDVPMRRNGRRVVRAAALRDKLNQSRPSEAIEVTGAATFAVAVLQPPWRQRFEGTVDYAGDPIEVAPRFEIATKITNAQIRLLIKSVFKGD